MNRPIRVLFVTRRFPPSVGGMEKFAYELSNSLSSKTRLKLIKWGGQNKYLPLVLPWFFLKSFWLLLTQKVDIIHAQDGVVSIVCLPLKIIFRKPLLIVVHGLDITYKSKLYQALIKQSLKRADKVICISHMAKEEVIKRIPTAKASFIPLGVTDDINLLDKDKSRLKVTQKLGLSKNVKIILSTGRLVKRKGAGWFISDVLSGLVKNDSNIVFLISGEGPEKETIKQTVSKLELDRNVRMLGRTSREFLRELYNGSDVFVMPNITVAGDMEGFGIVLLEAALCELPVVASGIEGITDAIINNQNGLLVGEKNTEAFAREITNLLSDKSVAIKFGRKSRQFTLENFHWPKVTQQYIEEYQKLLY